MAFDITIQQGADFQLVLNYKDPVDAPIDLTGYTVQSQIRDRPNGVLKQDFTALITDPVAGEITLSLTHDQTALLESCVPWHYDVLIESPGGVVDRIIQGKVKISPRVTVQP